MEGIIAGPNLLFFLQLLSDHHLNLLQSQRFLRVWTYQQEALIQATPPPPSVPTSHLFFDPQLLLEKGLCLPEVNTLLGSQEDKYTSQQQAPDHTTSWPQTIPHHGPRLYHITTPDYTTSRPQTISHHGPRPYHITAPDYTTSRPQTIPHHSSSPRPYLFFSLQLLLHQLQLVGVIFLHGQRKD